MVSKSGIGLAFQDYRPIQVPPVDIEQNKESQLSQQRSCDIATNGRVRRRDIPFFFKQTPQHTRVSSCGP